MHSLAAIIGGIIVYLIFLVITVLVAYIVIKLAIKNGINESVIGTGNTNKDNIEPESVEKYTP